MTTDPRIGQKGLRLTRTPHEIAVRVAHADIAYGAILENQPEVLKILKRAIFHAVCDAIVEASER